MSRQIFSKNLYHFQVAFNLEQQDLASQLGVSPQRVHNWISANAYPQVDIIIKLCDFFQYRDIYRIVTECIPPEEIREHASTVNADDQELASNL